MNKYRVVIHGQNYLIKLDDMIEKMGFYATRYVEAENEGLAESKAVALIQCDDKLRQVVRDAPDNPPVLHAEEILELANFEGVNPPGAEYSFYRYEDERDEMIATTKRLQPDAHKTTRR